MRKLFYILLFFHFSKAIIGQVNLVPNPSFENVTTCPNNFSQLGFALPWSQAGTGTPDLLSICATNSQVAIPKNELGYQFAHTGNSYSGIICFADDYREYIEVPLTSSLTAGIKYFISFFVSLGDTCANTSSTFGAYLSTTSLSATNYSPIPVTPQIQNSTTNYPNYNDWTKISGSFYSVGGEKHLTIGNFNSTTTTNTMTVNTNTLVYNGQAIYLYIDDVCITTDSLYNEMWTGISIYSKKNSQINIFPNPCSDILNIHSEDLIKEVCILDLYGNLKYYKV